MVTTADRRLLLAPLAVARTGGRPAEPLDARVVVDTTVRFQRMTGFGAAITDATVILLDALAPRARRALLQELFSPAGGAGFTMVRVPIGASDYSLRHYTLADSPAGVADTALQWFRFDGERARLALLREVRRMQPQLVVMGTPWSAPAWMKTPATLYGGSLRDDAMPYFARYLHRVVQHYDSAGVPLALLSVQNEPQHAPPDYPGMRLSPQQRATLVGRYLGPLLAALPRPPRLLEWDHNWDAPEEPLAVLADSTARGYLHGVAWHCYAGDVRAQDTVQQRHPQLSMYFTECAGGAWAPNFGDNLLWNASTLVVGATQYGARGVMLWNLALDPAGGPHLGGCTNCRGVVTIDPVTQQVTRNEEYYALAHAGRFVQRDAARVRSRLEWVTPAPADGVSQVAFRNPNGDVVIVIVNERTAALRLGVPHGLVTVPARSVVTVTVRHSR